MLSKKGMRKVVAVIGDVMIDRYLTGRVDRISPEAPVPVLLNSHDRAVAGGATNVAVNIVALGCAVRLVGAVGDDQDADDLKRILTKTGVSTALLVTDRSRPTISKTRVVSGRQQFFRIEADRARIVGALRAVDLGVLFDDLTPLSLIEAISPDVLVKGADYTEDQVVGGDLVKSRGGRVVLFPLIEGRSSTKIVERMRS
jgi:bifunctional ADP-heptose synthase (sugar kinase/adenylyltransferase)